MKSAQMHPLKNAKSHFYWWDDPTARYQADVLTEIEARRMAEEFAKLPELLKKP